MSDEALRALIDLSALYFRFLRAKIKTKKSAASAVKPKRLGLDEIQKNFLRAVNRVFAARFTLITPRVRLTTLLLLTTRDAEAGIVKRAHLTLYRVSDTVWRQAFV